MAGANLTKGLRTGSPKPGLAPVIAQGVVACLVAALLLGFSTRQEAEAAVAVPTQAKKASATCGDLLVVTIDGNGQGSKGDSGAVTGKIASRLEAQATSQGRRVSVERMRISTPRNSVLLSSRRAAAVKAVSKAGLKKWRKPIQNGVKQTRKLVNDRLAQCAEQQVVLVGYAQGAAVAHRVAQDVAKAGRLANVAAVVTVSDPYRVKKSSAGKALGNPGAKRGSVGVLTRFAKSVGDVPAATPTFRVISVCHQGDVVCDPSKTRGKRALALSGYSVKGSGKVLKDAADRASTQVARWPVPQGTQITVNGSEPFSQQLAVGGGSASAPAAVWTPVQVPAGLSLSSSGLLSGTLSTPGFHEVIYTVAGTNPVTTAKTGRLVVVVRAESGALSAGGQTTCEVREDGTAWCWGRNDFGQVGDNTRTTALSAVQVPGTDWARISSGGATTCAVKKDGTLWCWGLNNFGQLGGADAATVAVPRQVGTATTWKDVQAGWFHSCGIQTDGSLWCWGQNQDGQLGNGSTAKRSLAPVLVAGGATWSSVSPGGWHTCGVTTGGAAMCWGQNVAGQLGDASNLRRIRPTQVAGGGQFTQISSTWLRSCAVTAAGGVSCWGDNANGELGNGTRTDSNRPVAAAVGGETYAQVAAGVTSTCASATSGAVKCWGDNRYGQLGPGTGGIGSSPTPIASGATATGALVTSGWFHACASGTGCWGADDWAQAGRGALTPIPMPTKPAPTWPQGSQLTTAQVRSMGAGKIARAVLAGRPGVSARARGKRAGASFKVMTFNVLGTQHTSPTGTRPGWAPGRVRVEWSKKIIQDRDSTLVGMSEPQPDQIDGLNHAFNGAWTSYPGNTMGYDAAPQSVMWKDSDWEFVWGNTASMPFMRESRRQPVVRLRHRSSGQEIYWINAHLSPGKMQDDRDKGMAIISALVKELDKDGLPVLVTGDLNEHAKAFRRIACPNKMNAAVGGKSTGNKCVLPKGMRVDWVFGKRGSFASTLVDVSPLVRRTTDHAVVSSTFTVG